MSNHAQPPAWALFAFILCVARASAQRAPEPLKYTPQPTVAAITDGDLRSRIYAFADDSMQGRAAGSAGNRLATEYIASEVRRLGLLPAGENGSYFQQVPFVRQSLDTSSTIAAGDVILRAGTDFAGNGNLGSAPIAGTMGVLNFGVALDTVNLPPLDSVRGRLLILEPRRTPVSDPQKFLASSGYQAYQQALAAAAVVLVVAGDQITPPAVRALTGSTTALQIIPDHPQNGGTFVVTRRGAEALLGGSYSTSARTMSGRTAAVRIAFSLDRRPSMNVVAILPGSDRKLRGQYVAIGAHNDHIGLASMKLDHDSVHIYNTALRRMGLEVRPRPATQEESVRLRAMLDSAHAAHGVLIDSINNGADDDGSGSMGVLEIAEAFAKSRNKPKRSLLFVWHVGEELGMVGSRYFTDHPTVPLDSIVAQLNVDMIGRGASDEATGETKDGAVLAGRDDGYLQLIGSRRLSRELGDLVEQVNVDRKAGFQFDYALDADHHPQNIYCRSDHAMYARFGIPIVFFTTGLHQDYHQVSDEPQYLRFDHYRKATQFIHDVAERVADLDHRPLVDGPKPDPKAVCRQ